MKAIRVHEYGGPEVMQMEEIPDPNPGPGQVVVRLKAVGVNPVDVYIRSGEYGTGTLPYVPGFDAAGVVEAVGHGVTRVVVDDRVYVAGTLSGAYAEKALCEESQVHLIPKRISYKQGAGVGIPYTAAYRAFSSGPGRKPAKRSLFTVQPAESAWQPCSGRVQRE
jgi:NADPH:quinone reductase